MRPDREIQPVSAMQPDAGTGPAENGMDWQEDPVQPENNVPLDVPDMEGVGDAAMDDAQSESSLEWPDELDRSFGTPPAVTPKIKEEVPVVVTTEDGNDEPKVSPRKRFSAASTQPASSKAEIAAFIDKCWNAVTMRDGEVACDSIVHLLKDLQKLIDRPGTRPSLVSLAQQLLSALILNKENGDAGPLTEPVPDRQIVLKALSDFYHRYSVPVADGMERLDLTDDMHRDLLEMFEFILPCIHPDDDIMGPLEVMLEGHLVEKPFVSVWATRCLSKMAELHGQHASTLFQANAPLYGSRLAVMFLWCDEKEIWEMVTDCLHIYRLSGTVADCLRLLMPYLLQTLLLDGSEQAKEEMLHLANISVVPREKLFSDFIELFLPQMLVEAPSLEALDRGLTIVEETTGRPRGVLLAAENHWVYHKIFLSFYDKPKAVMQAIRYLAGVQGRELDGEAESDLAELAEYIQPRFLGFIFEADTIFKDPETSVRTKRTVLLSLARLIEFMGTQHIVPVRSKLLATLKTILQTATPELLPACFQAWNAFIEALDDASLKPMLCEIVVILTPFIDSCREQVVHLLEYLVLDKERAFRDHLPNLFFLPDIPELQRVRSTLASYSSRTTAVEQSFPEQLSEAIQSVGLDRKGAPITALHSLTLPPTSDRVLRIPHIEAKQYALKKLKVLVRSNQEKLYALVSSSDQRQQHVQTTSGDVQSQQETVVKLLNALVGGCRDAHTLTERWNFAQVLGSIGALDPDFVEIANLSINDPRYKLAMNVQQNEFACSFLKELVKGYMTAEKTSIQDHCGFVIQEALKFYNLNEESSWNSGELSKLLGHEYREILEPFCSTKYSFLDEDPSDVVNSAMPIFGTTSVSFSLWMRHWTVKLTDAIDTQTATADFFRKCSKLLLDDLGRCVILMPHIVAYLLLFSTCPDDIAKSIRSEMVRVLDSHERDVDPVFKHFATQTVMTLVDFLQQFSLDKTTIQYVRREMMLIDPNTASEPECKKLVNHRIRDFLTTISEESMAEACFHCGSYAKAFKYYEVFLRQQDSTLLQWRDEKKQVDFLQSIYVSLNEADGIRGVNDCRTSAPSAKDLVVRHLSSGNIQDALTCYQHLTQAVLADDQPDNPAYHGSVARCLLDLDQPTAAISLCNGILDDNPDWMGELNPLRVEAAWKLAQWGDLENYLENENMRIFRSNNWSVGVGRLLLAVKQGDSGVFWSGLHELQGYLMAPVCAASTETQAYHKAYDDLVLLHVLQEVEEGALTWFGITPDVELQCQPKSSEQLLSEWQLRLEVVQPSYTNMQKILSVRRILLEATGRDDVQQDIAACWLENAKMARKFHHLQTAYSYLLNAMPYSPLGFAREHAKYLWAKGEQEAAIDSLKRCIRTPSFTELDKHNQAKIKLITARYLDESQTVSGKELCDRYSEVVQLAPHLEKSHFFLGRYYDRVLEGMEKPAPKVATPSAQMIEDRLAYQKLEAEGEQMLKVMQEYISSLLYGCRFIHQCLPRVLSLWLDFGVTYQRVCSVKKGKLVAPTVNLQQIFDQIQCQIRRAIKQVPKYVFLVAFPQLISRIGNINEDVFMLLMELISSVSREFPQIAMWHLAPISRSKKVTRQRRYKRIMEYMQKDKNNIEVNRHFSKMEEFFDLCEKLCNLSVNGKVETALLSEFSEMKRLTRLLEDTSWLHPLLPFRAYMTPILPGRHSGTQDLAQHNPFPLQAVTIAQIEDRFHLLNSLQRPKRITIVDSEGRSHDLLLKPKDDLRKDSRFMELVELINKYLRQDAECRRRQLHVRGYAVVPLSEENGIVEWVPNMRPLRNIIVETYKKALKIDMKHTDVIPYNGNRDAPIEERLRLLRALTHKYRPVLSFYLGRQFPDASVYYANCLTYSRTCAVMSIVGYMMGLGDRHGENLLLDSNNATLMHCDFSCLFNKGETLDWPERVPFRLTQNMVDGLGPLGVEGFFREACELTLGVIRQQKASLISVLKTFVYDPLVEWQSGGSGGNNRSESGESANVEAVVCLERIQQRINGQIVQLDLEHVGTGQWRWEGLDRGQAPLSVRGQVSYLIREATSERLLCQMYVGWSPFM